MSDSGAPVGEKGPRQLLLVGRDAEVKGLQQLLVKGRPAVVLLSAETGVGKTTLLRSLVAAAASEGWTTLWSGRDNGPTTRLSDGPSFTAHVRTLSGLRPTDPLDQAQVPTGAFDSQRAVGPTERAGSVPRGIFGRLGHAIGKKQRVPALVQELCRHAPVLLVIDDFEPAAEFEAWFREFFVPAVVAADAQVVVIAAVRPSGRGQFDGSPVETVSLGPLDSDAVRRHLCALGDDLTPPFGATELDTYTKAACAEPSVLHDLTRILALGRREVVRSEAVPTTEPKVDV